MIGTRLMTMTGKMTTAIMMVNSNESDNNNKDRNENDRKNDD